MKRSSEGPFGCVLCFIEMLENPLKLGTRVGSGDPPRVCFLTKPPGDRRARQPTTTTAHLSRCDAPSVFGTVTDGTRPCCGQNELNENTLNSPHPVHFKKSRHMQYLHPQFSLQNGTKMCECYVGHTSCCVLGLCTVCLT